MMYIGIAIFVFLFSFPISAAQAEMNKDDVNKVLKRVENVKVSYGNISTLDAGMKERARKNKDTYDSEEFQNRLRDETARIKTLPLFAGTAEQDEVSHVRKRILNEDERIYLFISSSIPVETLRNYARDIDKLKDPRVVMVMRGFKGGMEKVRPTLNFIQEVIKKDRGCDHERKQCEAYGVGVQVDPLLFRRYRVDAVPAIVYARGVTLSDSEGCESEIAKDHFMVAGDANLGYVLEVLNRQAKAESIEGLKKALEGGYYNYKNGGENGK